MGWGSNRKRKIAILARFIKKDEKMKNSLRPLDNKKLCIELINCEDFSELYFDTYDQVTGIDFKIYRRYAPCIRTIAPRH